MQNTVKTILIVDDDPGITRTFARILQKNGYQTEVAQTGQEAIEKASRRSFDAALIDVCLADISGIELIEKIENASFNMVKIIITGVPPNLPQLGAGADAYLLKPVKPQELLAIVEEKIKGKL